MKNVSLIIVEKSGTLKSLTVKDFKEEELYKKCSFKKAEGFDIQSTWNIKVNGQKYSILLYAKSEGKAGTENKYEFPPPVDNKLFFGACILVGYLRDDSGEKTIFNLTIPIWDSIYEKLFGGFQDLNSKELIEEDEEEEDELDTVPKNKLSKAGYLKDGFVVDDNNDEEDIGSDIETESNEDVETDMDTDTNSNQQLEEDMYLDDIGSELSEESYEYSDDEN